jgi:hypothetical protein
MVEGGQRTGINAEVIKVKDIKAITKLRRDDDPSPGVDGVVKGVGKVLMIEEIKEWIS